MREEYFARPFSMSGARTEVSWRIHSGYQLVFLYYTWNELSPLCLLGNNQMMGRRPAISINELRRETLHPSLRDWRIARYTGEWSNSFHNSWGRNGAQIQISVSAHSLGLLHGALHLPTIKSLLLDLLLSIMACWGISLLQSVDRVLIIYQSYPGKRIALRYKLLSTS